MITFTRCQACHLRAVFRRHALGIAHRGPVPPLVLSADPAGLRVRHHQPHLAVEGTVPGRGDPGEVLALPLDALAALEGRDEEPVTLEATSPRRTIARMHERGIPQVREYEVPELDSLPAFPALPATSRRCRPPFWMPWPRRPHRPPTTPPATPWTASCSRATPARSSPPTAGRSSSRAASRCPGRGTCWCGTRPAREPRLAPRVPLPLGKTATHVVLRIGPWTLWLTIQADARFPRIDGVLPDDAAVTTRLQLDPKDVVFLTTALDRLPGDAEHHAPLTLDCNGSIAVRARGAEAGSLTELVLARSRYDGTPVRLAFNRRTSAAP